MQRHILALIVMFAASGLPGAAGGVMASPSELAEARRWAEAKFQGVQTALMVLANQGPVQKEARGGGPMTIADKRAAYSTEPPFSFVYGGKPRRSCSRKWPCQRASQKLDEQRTERASVWTDPGDRLAGALRRDRVWRFPDGRVGGAFQEHRRQRHADPVGHPGSGP